MTKPKSNRGGRRAGAGRKHAGTVQQVVRIKPETKAWLNSEARKNNCTLGQVIDKMKE